MKKSTTLQKVRSIASLLLILLSITSYGKNKVTFTVIEKETGTWISFAIVSIPGKANNKPIGMIDLSGMLSTDEIEIGQKITVTSLGYAPLKLVVSENKSEIIVQLKKGIELKDMGTSLPPISYGYRCYEVEISGYVKPTVPKSDFKGSPGQLSTNNKNTIKIYPNPARSITRLSTGMEDYLLEVFDCTGKLVLHFEWMNDDRAINVEKLKAGIYFCRTAKGSLVLASRLVIN